MRRNPRARLNLNALGRDILAAAEKNGIDRKEVISGAKRRLLNDIYGKMFRALDKGNFALVEQAAAEAIRANGTLGDAMRAMENRSGRVKQKLTKEERAAIRKAYARP